MPLALANRAATASRWAGARPGLVPPPLLPGCLAGGWGRSCDRCSDHRPACATAQAGAPTGTGPREDVDHHRDAALAQEPDGGGDGASTSTARYKPPPRMYRRVKRGQQYGPAPPPGSAAAAAAAEATAAAPSPPATTDRPRRQYGPAPPPPPAGGADEDDGSGGDDAPPETAPFSAVEADRVLEPGELEQYLQERDSDMTAEDVLEYIKNDPDFQKMEVGKAWRQWQREERAAGTDGQGTADGGDGGDGGDWAEEEGEVDGAAAAEVAGDDGRGAGDAGGDNEAMAARGRLIMELLAAPSVSALEEKIASSRDLIDGDLIEMLQRRLELAVRFGEGDEAAEQLSTLLGVLRGEVERGAASPAMRLLDEVLGMLGDDVADEEEYEGRRLEALARMRAAFTGGGASDIDIFSAAFTLASNPAAADQLRVEAVSVSAFVAEASELLEQAREGQAALEGQIAQAEERLEGLLAAGKGGPRAGRGRGRAGDAGQGEEEDEWEELRQQVELAKRARDARELGLLQLEDVVALARALGGGTA